MLRNPPGLLSIGLLASVAVTALGGCQTHTAVNVGDLVAPKAPAARQVVLLSRATDARENPSDKVGRHTISLFTIPGPSVNSDGSLEEAVGLHAKEALEKAGYRVLMVDRVEDAGGPVVAVQIDDLRNYSFTWLYPLGILWGKMTMSLIVLSPQGERLWSAQTEGHGGKGASFLYIAGFGGRVKSDLTENLNQIIEISSSEEFGRALEQAEATRVGQR